ncbi:phage virion morphogenesis protein [Methylosinus sp. Sm6]|uniref:phage virion morphogenesis protein n=1 Tax=Methylosinus sp. Sm6 TaxID=2866948 RepID=UPI001C99A598|nr:phage virion morphogenesis protein [Methylosinus sp. Sm6]MBY6244131.1 phage virion morphogenesis protein [Methylosinus sp. Sm6]
MDGVSFRLDVSGLQAALTRLNRLGALEKHELMEGLGRLGQQQTRRRIEVEKTTPAGEAWKPTIEGRGALFVTSTHLWRSIDYAAGETETRWGSGWIAARVHQFGAVIKPVAGQALTFMVGGKQVFAKRVTIPARTYIGLSKANEEQMIRTAERFISMVTQ